MMNRRPTRAFLAAALFFLPIAATPASADPAGPLREALDDTRAQAREIRREIMLAQMSQDAAVHLNRRLDELERLIQALTNKIDTLDAQNRELQRDFDRFKNDVEFRLSQAEKSPRQPATRPAAPPPERNMQPERREPERKAEVERRAVTPPVTPPTARNNARQADDEPPPRNARRSDDRDPDRDRQDRDQADADRGAPAGGARDQYEHALGLLRRADYKGAEAALRDFVRRYPNDSLAANAYYWLGENYYAQGRFQDAASQFAEGYRKFPNHPKAQDSLFKLALSAARQGKTGDACASFAEFRRRYPNAGLRREAEAEQRRLNCSG
jgi:tol-pal system protein YbgF